MAGLRKRKPVIVVPRLHKYGEHVDDHQIEAAHALKHNKCLLICMNIEYLKFMVDNIDNYEFKPYIEPERKVEDIVIHCIEDNSSYSEKHSLTGLAGLLGKNEKMIKKSASTHNGIFWLLTIWLLIGEEDCQEYANITFGTDIIVWNIFMDSILIVFIQYIKRTVLFMFKSLYPSYL